jgi:hypothetical protein
MEKLDISSHSDNELSLIIMNNESFYRLRRDFNRLKDLIDQCFIYTDDQLEELKQTLKEDEEKS